jgi:hypothetical protein
MGLGHADIELVNGEDLILAKPHLIGEEEIRRMQVSMLVHTGSIFMCIKENIREQVQLPVLGQRKGQLANGHIVEYDLAGPLEVRFKNRRCSFNAMVLPGDKEPLPGAIPLEKIWMSLSIHTARI